MLKQKGQSFLYLVCPVCQGSGREAKEECSRCQGKGAYAWLEGNYLFWDRKIDILHLLEEKMEKTVRLSLNGFLIIFGILGLVLAVITVAKTMERGMYFWEFIFQRNFMMTIFAISLVTDLYTYYRLTRESLLNRLVKRKTYETFLTEESPLVLFDQIVGQDKEKLIEISMTFTNDAIRAVDEAWLLAKRLGHQEVVALHLLGVLLPFANIRVVMARLGINPKNLTKKISNALKKIPVAGKESLELSPELKKILLGAYEEAYLKRKDKVDVPQLLVAMMKIENLSKEILYDLEIELNDVQNVVEWINIQEALSHRWHRWRGRATEKPKGVMNRSMTAVATPLLDRFSHDMTQLARMGALMPCIGREKEMEEVFRILEGGRNNVILVGNPGVGKSSIAEGIAELMTSEEVPDILQDKRLVSLSVASLVGAAGRQGELEGRLLDIINEIVRAGNIVLFIDNLQNMVGVSTEMAENLDISDILAQALSKRLFMCIATTTPIDYRRYIEKSSSLTSVFQKVNVEEVNEDEAIRILEEKAGIIENKNQVYFSYESIERTVELAQRYIHDRYLPEKAINILEEVAVYVRKKKGKNSIIAGEDVAEIISTKTNVPVTRVTEEESEKLLKLEQRIHQRIVDQEEAVKAVSTALRRARAELRDIRRPIVNLLFLGPTGVGKTELAKTVAEVYFGSEDNMLRLDMSEYQEKSSINRLIGAPPGYSGATEGGYLTEAVRTNPFALLLLDEIEKAHPDILNIFLQVMDDGRLTDTLGRTIDFTNVILIGTSNAGTPLIQKRMREGLPLEQIKLELINEELGNYFRPEFLNRFDNIIVFKPLTFEEIVLIVGLLLKKVEERLSGRGIALKVTKEAAEELARIGFDPVFGARPLRRAIQDRVDNALANYLLSGKLGRRDVAILEQGGQIRVERATEL